MQPIKPGVTPLDLQNIRKLNEDALQTRATEQLGGEVRSASRSSVSKEEKEVAGQEDAVEFAPTPKKSASVPVKKSESAPQDPPSVKEEASEEEEPTQAESAGVPEKLDYTESERAFLERLEELNNQAKELRAMWRKLYMEWYEAQLKWMEDLENFRQSTGLLWTEVSVARWGQGERHSEAFRALL